MDDNIETTTTKLQRAEICHALRIEGGTHEELLCLAVVVQFSQKRAIGNQAS
jgi:hypothetical protein